MAVLFTLWITASFILVFIAGCSSNSLKRHTYQSLQIMQQQQCQQYPDRKCPPPEDYDTYQRQREQSLKQ